MKIYLIREFLPSYNDCINKLEWKIKWRQAINEYSKSKPIKSKIEKVSLFIFLLIMIGTAILCKIKYFPTEMVLYALPLLPICLIIGNEHLKSVDKIYFQIKKSAQQVDAPEPATKVSPALQTPHRPAR